MLADCNNSIILIHKMKSGQKNQKQPEILKDDHQLIFLDTLALGLTSAVVPGRPPGSHCYPGSR